MAIRAIVLTALALAVAFSFWGTVGKPDCGDLDFGAYYRAAAAVRAGRSPYQLDEHGPMGAYSYAPAYSFLLVPLTYLDYPWAFRLWLGLNWLATVGAFILGLKLLEVRSMDRWSVCLLAGVPMAGYLWANLRVGQAAMFVLLACLGWAWCQRRDRPFIGGWLLAAAGMVKLAPFVLVPWLLLRRDWRGLAGAIAGMAMIVVLPTLWVGIGETANLHLDWSRHTLATQVPMQTYRPGNQSLLAQLARLPLVGNGHTCYSPDNLAALCRAYPFLFVGLAGGLYLLLGKRRPTSDTAIDNISLALLLVFMTLGHPRAWRCNFVALLFPCLMLAAIMLRREDGWRMALAGLAALILAAIWPTHGVGEGSWSLGAWLLLGKHFWAALAVACFSAMAMHQPVRSASEGFALPALALGAGMKSTS